MRRVVRVSAPPLVRGFCGAPRSTRAHTMTRATTTTTVMTTTTTTALCEARRGVLGPRQHAPKGYREAAARTPMTFAFGEECHELARVAHMARNYGDAVALYDRALAMRREKHGPIHVECAATLQCIGRVFLDMKEYAAAENALTEAAAIYEQVSGPTSLAYAEALALLARAYTHLRFLAEAEKAFKDSLRIYRDRCYNHARNSWLPDDDDGHSDNNSSSNENDSNNSNEKNSDNNSSSSHSDVVGPVDFAQPQKHPLAAAAHALADCAALFLLQDEPHRAIAFLEEALDVRRYLYRRHQKYRPIIAQTLNKLAELRKGVDDAVGAELCINECLSICVDTLGHDHAATAHALSTKASIVAAQRRFRDALKLYEQSTATYARVLGKDAPLYAQELVKLARIQELTDDFATAERTYRKGLALVQATCGADSVHAAEAHTFLGSLLAKTYAAEEATTHFRDAVRIRKAADAKDPQLAFLYQKLGEAYALQRSVHAEAYFLLAIDAFRANAAVESVQRAYLTDVLDDLGLFYLDFQHLDKAEQCLKESLDTRLDMLGDCHTMIAYSYSNFALLYLHKKDYDACVQMAQRALALYGRTAQTNQLAHADVHTTLGQCYFAQQRCVEAMAWHAKALNIRRTYGDGSALAVGETLNYMARVHCALSEYGAAQRCVHEAQRIVGKYAATVTQTLRSELARTEEQLPPSDTWTDAQRHNDTSKTATTTTTGEVEGVSSSSTAALVDK